MDMLVLAGGFGKRLQGVVSDPPKPMAPVNGVPLLQLQMNHWIDQGQHSFIFLLHYKADIVVRFLAERSRYFGSKVRIQWVIEDFPQGTGGAVANALSVLGISGSVIIANADTWLDSGINELKNSRHSSVIGISSVSDTRRYGLVSLNDKNLVTGFEEKKLDQKNFSSGLINAGLYKLPACVFSGKKSKDFSLENGVLKGLISESKLYAEHLEGCFFDIGVPEDYFKFCEWHHQRD